MVSGGAAQSAITTALPKSPAVFPLDLLDMLNYAWREICNTYDVAAELPEWHDLFKGTDLGAPQQAAQTIIANMLSEVIECVGRFSPWYKQSAEAFGLILTRDSKTDRHRWVLSPEAVRRWDGLIEPLSIAIQKNIGLILASSLLSDTIVSVSSDRPHIMACCLCTPPRIIIVDRSVFAGTEIVCDSCQQPFRPIDEPPDASVNET